MSIKESVQKFFGRRINEKGQEVPDPTPVALPLGYKAPEPIEVRIQRMIREGLSYNAQRVGFETWEEANDFNVDDPDGIPFRDEDDQFAVNDPNVQHAFQEEVPRVQASIEKIRESKKAKAAPPPAPAAPSAPAAPAPNQ